MLGFSTEANVAQLVEQLIRNQQVSGSNPLVGSSASKRLRSLLPGREPYLTTV